MRQYVKVYDEEKEEIILELNVHNFPDDLIKNLVVESIINDSFNKYLIYVNRTYNDD
jgi:hypothetical protein